MKRKVAVAMSGGVDSSVAAVLLKNEGFEVIGITLALFQPEHGGPACCGAAEAGARARSVCGDIGVRHYIKNAEGIFGRKVIDGFIKDYSSGRTPNPCVDCNRFVKFSYLFDLARALGADSLATGHYARIETSGGGARLLRGLDPLKDQSYFLYRLRKEQLGHILFPLGALEKREVRKLAAGLTPAAAAAKESSDICFVGGGAYADYLGKKGLKPRPGRIVDARGKILGRHNGFFNYTIGQRRGLGVHGGDRLYVTALRPGTNEVVLGGLDEAYFRSFTVSDLNWLARRPAAGDRIMVQIRYRHKPVSCLAVRSEAGLFSGVFETPQFAPAAGQSAVFYDGDRVLGGGVIETVGKTGEGTKAQRQKG